MCANLFLAASLFSIHLHAGAFKYNDYNPGLSVQCGKWETGAYYNSIKQRSIYAAYRFEYALVGIVSGYWKTPIPSIALYKDFGNIETICIPFVAVNNNKIDDYGVAIGFKVRFKL